MHTGTTSPTGIEQGRRRNRWLLPVALSSIMVGALAVGVAMGGQNTGIFDGEPPRWASNLGRVLVFLGVIVEVAVLVWVVRTGRYRAARQSPLLTLSWSHRRRLARQVRRGTPETDEDPALLVETARQFAGQRWFVVLAGGLAMTSVGQAFVGFAPFFAVIGGLLLVIWAVLIVSVFRNAHRGEAFLRDHPDLSGR